MTDLSQSVKSKVLAALDAAGAVTALVPASRIFPRQVAAKTPLPYLRYEGDSEQYEHSCGRGVEASVRIHVFAVGEADCEQICAAVVSAVTAMTTVQSALYQRTQFLPDEEADVWHGLCDFRIVHTN